MSEKFESKFPTLGFASGAGVPTFACLPPTSYLEA
jgi:hypothetical protein